MRSTEVLCVDIGSGGISAVRFNERLDANGYDEVPWNLPISAETLERAFQRLLQSVCGNDPVAAISISSFMHSFLVVDRERHPLTPIHTWMDGASPEGIAAIRKAIGQDFHPRTGCHYHPMFPVFKLAESRVAPEERVVSPKAYLIESLTGQCVEDYGMAAASGLLNAKSAAWDSDILHAVNLSHSNLPKLMDRGALVGKTSDGIPVVNGSGDGFMANVGSGCESPNRISITLGTSAAVRQMVAVPVLDAGIGTFCYRATSPVTNTFLLGCASSNGGNALDWARREFGVSTSSEIPKRDIPIFLPWLNGERSLEWDSELLPEWHDRRDDHRPEELFRSVLEGVLFNLAQYVEVIEKASGIPALEMVLSGNGFLDPAAAPVLAKLISRPAILPESSGLGTLRGSAVCAWRAIGHDAVPAVERLVQRGRQVEPVDDNGLGARYERFKEIREIR